LLTAGSRTLGRVRAYLTGASLLVMALLTGVLIAPGVRGNDGPDHARSAPRPGATATQSVPSSSAGTRVRPPALGPATSSAPVKPGVNLGFPITIGFGDSITFKPHSWFRQVCKSAVVLQNCLNEGISGNTTTQMVARLDTDVLLYDPSIVIVMGGTNDLKQRSGPKAVLRRLDVILQRVRSSGAIVVLCTVPPRRHFETQALALNSAIRSYAGKGNVPLLDLYSSVGLKGGSWKPGLTKDGVHPTRRAADLMTAAAEKQLPKLLTSGSPLPGRGSSPTPTPER
jgi:lysophospholipase L1-like esterase